jgi:hypothetical protein
MGEVGLHVGDRPRLGDLREFARREQALAGRQRTVHAAGDVGHRSRIPGLDDFLAEQRPDGRDGVDVGDRRIERIRPAVEVRHDIDLVAHAFAHGGSQLFDMQHGLERRVVAGIGHEAELDGIVPHLDGLLHGVTEGADIGIGNPGAG